MVCPNEDVAFASSLPLRYGGVLHAFCARCRASLRVVPPRRQRECFLLNLNESSSQSQDDIPSSECKDAVAEFSSLPQKLREKALSIGTRTPLRARYEFFLSLGDSLDTDESHKLPDNECTRSTRVPGCTAVAHISVSEDSCGIAHLRGTADARISRGIIALIVGSLSGASVSEILQIKEGELALATGIPDAPRVAGMGAALRHVKRALMSKGKGSFGIVQEKKGEHVAVLLSGGVDSAVALRRVLESGKKARAYYLKIWLDDELSHLGECPWEEDIRYARNICTQANVQLEEVPLQKEYWESVVSYVIEEARAGRTPNPDVMCNSRVKFGAFYKALGKNGAATDDEVSYVASGHYARIDVDNTGRARLLAARDVKKDQTYFLAGLKQGQLKRVLFPIGDLEKKDVRALAERYGLCNANRPDSQGICFLGRLRFDSFLKYHLGTRTGRLVEFETGAIKGIHNGFWFFTLGQRRGIGVSNGPWYVVAKDVSENTVYISKKPRAENVTRNIFQVEQTSWIIEEWPDGIETGEEFEACVQVRHGGQRAKCRVLRTGLDEAVVKLETAQHALAPGQFAVFYKEDLCLGCAVIKDDRVLTKIAKDAAEQRLSHVQQLGLVLP